MWKRDPEASPAPAPAASTASPSYQAPVRRESDPARGPRLQDAAPARAIVGGATLVRGELTGEENLLIEGRFEGKIQLPKNVLTVGATGHVAAEILASAIVVEGEVQGNLVAEEEIVIRRSGRVRGDLLAPRVTIEDGARFKGSIDMDARPPAGASAGSTAPAAPGASDDLAATVFAVGGVDS